nr:hypothetical protein CFP56_66484 [Quercus suber]
MADLSTAAERMKLAVASCLVEGSDAIILRRQYWAFPRYSLFIGRNLGVIAIEDFAALTFVHIMLSYIFADFPKRYRSAMYRSKQMKPTTTT